MSEWFETLDGLRERVWARLAMAALQSDVVTLATVSPESEPEARSVVLRDADPEAGTLAVYTDLESAKITSLRHHPRASFLIWDADLSLQIRAQCQVTILTGDVVAELWDDVPDHARLSYGITPPPGQVIVESDAYQKAPDQAVFAVLSCMVDAFDIVHLGKPHRRARLMRAQSQPGEWVANWLAP